MRRLLWAGILFIAVTMVSYIIFFLVPAEPARLICGPQCPPDQIERVREQIGLDRPVWQQYVDFLDDIVVHQSLGRSYATRQPVNEIIKEAAPITASVVVGGVILWLLIAIPVGIFSALRPRSLLDRGAMTFVLIGISAHPVWIGLILIYFVGYRAGLTPLGGYCDLFNPSTDCGGPVQWAHALVLPWVTFALLYAALYTRMIRANVLEAMNEDYVRTARAKGAPEWLVMRSHVLRNAMLPIVTMLGLDIGVLLGGAIFTEQVFGLPGLGKTAITHLEGFDLPTVMGITVFATLAVIVCNLIVDLVYAAIDPRIRLA
ncbi:MAG: ABC transporter permease [Actinomycetota bacterium]|nr:ABC transporter permease [Actinomycetota bacterium]